MNVSTCRGKPETERGCGFAASGRDDAEQLRFLRKRINDSPSDPLYRVTRVKSKVFFFFGEWRFFCRAQRYATNRRGPSNAIARSKLDW